MTIIIGNKTYSGTLTSSILEDMCKAIKALPEPEVVPAESAKLNSEEVLLCLQREMIYVDQFTLSNSVRYMGSKYIADCILVWIYSETDNLVVHADSTETLDFTDSIAYFNYKTGLRVSLAGGTVSQQSEDVLRRIILALIKTSEKLQIDITIASQKIIESNRFTSLDRYDFVFDKMNQKLDIISRQFFRKPIDRTRFQHRTAVDLRTRPVKGQVAQHMLLLMSAMFSQSAEIYGIDSMKQPNFVHTQFQQLVSTEKKFLELADLMFSCEGFDVENLGWTASKKYPDGSLGFFVFDLQNRNICRIGMHTETPHEIHRLARIMDRDQDIHYTLVYNGRLNKFTLPSISSSFIASCLKLKSYMIGNYIDKKYFINLLGVRDIEYQYHIIKFIRALQEQKVMTFNSTQTFFSQPRQSTYLGFNEIPPTQKLLDLNKLSGYPFIAIQRAYSKSTIDAIYNCESSDKGNVIKEELAAKGIIAVVEILPEGKFRVCVSAINEIPPTENLLSLNKLSGYPFIAVQRAYPKSTIDAIYNCESNEKGNAIKGELAAKGIIAVVETLPEEKYRVCVPAINITHYADAINTQYKQLDCAQNKPPEVMHGPSMP